LGKLWKETYILPILSFCLLKNWMHFSGGNAKKISIPKLKPRYLCDYIAELIVSTFKWKLDKHSFHSPNNFWFRWKLFNTVLSKPSWVGQNCQRKPRSRMAQGWSQVSQRSFSQILLLPRTKFSKILSLFSVCQL
jgi:hypothetical protein